MNMQVLTYLRAVRNELSHVTWPTRAEVYRMTWIVLGGSLLVGLYVGGLDYAFTSLLSLILQ